MLPRFHAPALDPAALEVALPPDESAHLTRVLRLGPGDAVTVFDGRGLEFHAQVARIVRGIVTLTLTERISAAAEPAVRLALVQAVLKADAMDDVIRDATMMGAARIDPLITSHVAVKEHLIVSGRAVERWRRIAVSSTKQCRRATVPDVAEPRRFDAWLRDVADDDWKLMLVEPAAMQGDESDLRALAARPRPASVALLVGPEGGWSPDERARAAAAGCVPVSLGALTLRADAVPVAAIAVLRFILGDL